MPPRFGEFSFVTERIDAKNLVKLCLVMLDTEMHSHMHMNADRLAIQNIMSLTTLESKCRRRQKNQLQLTHGTVLYSDSRYSDSHLRGTAAVKIAMTERLMISAVASQIAS